MGKQKELLASWLRKQNELSLDGLNKQKMQFSGMSFFRIHLDSMSIRWSGCVYRTFQSDKGAKWGAIYFHNDYFNRYIVITWACVYSSFYCCTYKRNYVCMYRPDFPDTKKPKGTNFKFSWLFKIMMLGLTSKNSSKKSSLIWKEKKKGNFTCGLIF